MSQQKINEDYLLLLVTKNGLVDSIKIEIDKKFHDESVALLQLCGSNNDNINDIVQFIKAALQPKLPNKEFKYCRQLDKAYQSVRVNVELETQYFLQRRDLIYINEKLAEKEEKEFDIIQKFRELKDYIRERVLLWIQVFETELAYEKAKRVPNMLVYSHRISGWSSPEYKITNNLKQEVKTNFGYGSASYFYSLLTFKNIQITPLSEWIDYRYSNFSHLIRYTQQFGIRYFTIQNGLKRFHVKIENSDWIAALTYTQNAANLSILNEDEFIEKFIIDECEKMVEGLETFFKDNEFDIFDEEDIKFEGGELQKSRLSLKGFELIDFKTEKIIGALDFISKIIEYNSIVSTEKYILRIIELNKKFIPYVFSALDFQKQELIFAERELEIFLEKHNVLVEKNLVYESEKQRLKSEFTTVYGEVYTSFEKEFEVSLFRVTQYQHNITLHKLNITKLQEFILKYQSIVTDDEK